MEPIIVGEITKETLIRSKGLEDLTNLTDRRLRQLADEGYLPQPDKGLYKLADSLLGLIRYYKEQANAGSEELEVEEVLKLRAERKLSELKLERAKRAVIPAKSVHNAWSDIIVTAQQKFLTLGSKCTSLLGGDEKMRKVIEEETRSILTELSETEPTYVYSKEAEDDPFFEEELKEGGGDVSAGEDATTGS